MLTAERRPAVLHHRDDSLDGIRAAGIPFIVLEQHCARGLVRGPRPKAGPRWCSANRHRLAGIDREIYGDWTDDPTKLETTVCYLLA